MQVQANAISRASTSYTLSVVRLAPPEHSHIAELNASIKGSTFSLCSDNPLAESWPVLDEAGEMRDPVGSGPPGQCLPETTLPLNVSSETETVLLHLRLLYPHVQVGSPALTGPRPVPCKLQLHNTSLQHFLGPYSNESLLPGMCVHSSLKI